MALDAEAQAAQAQFIHERRHQAGHIRVGIEVLPVHLIAPVDLHLEPVLPSGGGNRQGAEKDEGCNHGAILWEVLGAG